MINLLDNMINTHIVLMIVLILLGVCITLLTRRTSIIVRLLILLFIFGGYYYLQLKHPAYINALVSYFTDINFSGIPKLI